MISLEGTAPRLPTSEQEGGGMDKIPDLFSSVAHVMRNLNAVEATKDYGIAFH